MWNEKKKIGKHCVRGIKIISRSSLTLIVLFFSRSVFFGWDQQRELRLGQGGRKLAAYQFTDTDGDRFQGRDPVSRTGFRTIPPYFQPISMRCETSRHPPESQFCVLYTINNKVITMIFCIEITRNTKIIVYRTLPDFIDGNKKTITVACFLV